MDKEKLLIEWNDKILEFLLNYRKEHPGFKFWLRSRESTRSDDQGRLAKGIWFQGSHYIFISFHNGSGGTNMTRSIGWVVEFDDNGKPRYYIEVVWPQETNQNLISAYREIIDRLGGFKKINDFKYSKDLPNNDLLKSLTDHIEITLPIINQCINAHNVTDLMTIPDEKFDRQLQRVLQIREQIRSGLGKISKESTIGHVNLNTILFGPPGTGKTYNTILKAAEIIEGDSYDGSYDAAKVLYKNLLGGQIEFVTFHQNYSYEDFVAGLRPDVDASSIGLRFKEHRGIFYKICERAKENYIQHISGQTYIEPSFEDALEVFLEPLILDEEIEVNTIARNVTFNITANNNGRNLSFRKQSGGTSHTLSLATMKDIYEGRREQQPQGLSIYYRPIVDKLKEIAKGLRKETGKIALKKYVLIIDEINRANISRVFGELITLLEPDKRLGAKHELLLTLPGLPDDEKFTVPLNLYIVGTMNTADKSIALLDIALRRRFHFEPLYPDTTIEGVKYPDILEAINAQILEKKGADFLIGHAYFMNDENDQFNLADTMNHKVIPLMNEYFYNQRGDMVKSIIENAIKGKSMTVVYDHYKQLKFSDQ